MYVAFRERYVCNEAFESPSELVYYRREIEKRIYIIFRSPVFIDIRVFPILSGNTEYTQQMLKRT